MSGKVKLSFEDWVDESSAVLKNRYCIDFLDAGLEKPELRKYYQQGQRPAEFVEWFAIKYDLIEFQKSIYTSHRATQ